MSFSKVIVLGNLGKDPAEIRYLQSGTPVTSFSVCANERTANGGEVQNWYEVNVYGNSAESCAEHLAKGDTIYTEGRLEVQVWRGRDDAPDAEPRVTKKVNTNNVQFISKAASRRAAEAATGADVNDDELPI